MAKYHIDKNGKPAICKATKQSCPLGGDDVHFDSAEEAQAFADKMNAVQHGMLAYNEHKEDSPSRKIEDYNLKAGDRLELLYQKANGDTNVYNGDISEVYSDRVLVETPNGYRMFIKDRVQEVIEHEGAESSIIEDFNSVVLTDENRNDNIKNALQGGISITETEGDFNNMDYTASLDVIDYIKEDDGDYVIMDVEQSYHTVLPDDYDSEEEYMLDTGGEAEFSTDRVILSTNEIYEYMERPTMVNRSNTNSGRLFYAIHDLLKDKSSSGEIDAYIHS